MKVNGFSNLYLHLETAVVLQKISAKTAIRRVTGFKGCACGVYRGPGPPPKRWMIPKRRVASCTSRKCYSVKTFNLLSVSDDLL